MDTSFKERRARSCKHDDHINGTVGSRMWLVSAKPEAFMKNPTKSVEIPPVMQEMADQSMQQAKKAFDMYIAGVRQALNAFGDNTPMASAGGKEIGERALQFVERNIEL